MKKLVLLAALLLPLTLAGCKNKKKDDFKEFDFGEKVIANERAEVLQKVFEQLKNVVSETVEEEEKTDLYNEYRLQKAKGTINYYSNNYLHIEQTTESTAKEDGVTAISKTTIKNDKFISSDSKFFATATSYKDTIRPSVPEQLTFAYDVIPAEDDPADYFDVLPESDPTQFGGLDLYKKGKEYKLVNSSITETEEPIIYAEDTKTLHLIEKEQHILSIDSKFRITKGEYLSYQASNRDDNNNQYFDEVKIYHYQKNSSTYKYGTRKAGDFSALESRFNAPMLEVNTNNVGLGEYKDSAFTPKSNIPLTISGYYFESYQKRHVEFTFSFKATETDNAIAFDDNEADILNGVTTTDPIKDVMYKIPVGEFLSDIEGLSLAAEKTAEGHEIILAEPGSYKLRLSFDLAVTAADAVDVSNISLIQSYNYGGGI